VDIKNGGTRYRVTMFAEVCSYIYRVLCYRGCVAIYRGCGATGGVAIYTVCGAT
jgi:hypothetical protein